MTTANPSALESAERTGWRQRLPSGSAFAVLGAIAAAFLLAALTSSAFLTSANLKAVINNASITGIVAVCATSLTLSGNFFSIALGQTATFCGLTFGVLMRAHAGFAPAVLGALGAAVVIGAVQGGVTALGANPIITTLGASSLLSGLAGWTAGPDNVQLPQSSAENWLGSGTPLGIPTQTWLFVAIAVVVTGFVHRSRSGRLTVLTGTNRQAARAAGIVVWRVTVLAFVLASLGAAVVGVVGTSQFNLATLDAFPTLDFNVVAAILVGGTAVNGGIGSPLRSAVAAIFIALVDNYLLLKGWPVGTRQGVLGLIVIVAALTFHLVRRRRRATG
jgi:ribose transport system permease protein